MSIRYMKHGFASLHKTQRYFHFQKTRQVIRGASSSQHGRSFPRIEWFYIPAGVGFGLICFIQMKHIWRRETKNQYGHSEELRFQFKEWQVDVLKNIPTRTLSRMWGYCCDAHLPLWLRKPLINSYSYFFNCNLEEALNSDPKHYTTFNKFFTRQLKPGVRDVHPTATVVSPADSTVLTFGCIDSHDFHLDQIKGLSYPLKTFVGASHPFYKSIYSSFRDGLSPPLGCPSQVDGDDFRIFYCTLYLGPGDYHWFHSPAEWTVEHRRHVPGHLFSVNPRALSSINGIFNFNERVLLSGHWKYGPFLYGAIGAYNVGSIKLDFHTDKDLTTNDSFWKEKYKDRLYGTGILLKRGETIGRFELGSSLVLVFTAPKNFKFTVEPGDKLLYGQPVGVVPEEVD